MSLAKLKKNKPVKGWPVSYLDPCGVGTLYVPALKISGLIKQHEFAGQAWKYKNMWKTYRPGGEVSYKSLEGINPSDEEDFWHIMGSNYRAGLPPPSSFSAIFHKLCPLPWPKHSQVAPFLGFPSGAWSEALECRTFSEKMYHYDLNSAYRWAACQGLPLMKSGVRVFDIQAEKSVFLVDCENGERPPWFKDKTGLLSSEEVQALGIRPRVLFGVQYRDWFDLTSMFTSIQERFPWCYKRISRAFWGRWNGGEDLTQHGWAGGHKVRAMPNTLHNPIWSHLITSRVKLRLLEAVKQVGAVHVQVDAVLCRDPLPVSAEVGAWKLVEEFESGLWIHRTGTWGYKEFIVKRMAMNARESEQWTRRNQQKS